ncbi:hypothetical protein HMF8227_00065 [Saliniradius amylolyticus]|uniref:DUF1820 family protein n=1 Tax=Saliniradius amylolyticus TaxID=2183582 RepID=A0A2S2DYZ6_9ALTE|nr:DUF1820 family protein [Saliniradius amylolyticus]AWL10573.1 hypothetical protein HMF8227_00065 [Saliniradius amylolyticus]
MSQSKSVYRVQFISNAERYELYVREVAQGAMFGFVEIGDFVWDNRSGVVVDPSEEKLKSEFEGVERTYIPMHNVLRIDQVKHRGSAKVTELGDKVTPFPQPAYTPKN